MGNSEYQKLRLSQRHTSCRRPSQGSPTRLSKNKRTDVRRHLPRSWLENSLWGTVTEVIRRKAKVNHTRRSWAVNARERIFSASSASRIEFVTPEFSIARAIPARASTREKMGDLGWT